MHKPTVLVTQHGCDSHRQDPLADLNPFTGRSARPYLALASLADELCGGRWRPPAAGGYSVLNVGAWAWTHLLGIVRAAGRPEHSGTRGLAGRGRRSRRRPPCLMARMPASVRSMRGSRRRAASIRRFSQRDRQFSPSWVSIRACDRIEVAKLGNQLVVNSPGGVSRIFPMYLLYQQHRLPLFSLQYLRRWRGSRRGTGYRLRVAR